MDYSSSPWPNPMKVEWSKTVTVAGNTIVLQLGSHGKSLSHSPTKMPKTCFSMFTCDCEWPGFLIWWS